MFDPDKDTDTNIVCLFETNSDTYIEFICLFYKKIDIVCLLDTDIDTDIDTNTDIFCHSSNVPQTIYLEALQST